MRNIKHFELKVKIVIALILFLIFVLPLFSYWSLGICPFGPDRTLNVRVLNKHVDIGSSAKESTSKSHYMVTTDQGTFEVDNLFFLWVWNADELYGKLQEGRTYTITARGNKVVNMFFQEYPYIYSVKPCE